MKIKSLIAAASLAVAAAGAHASIDAGNSPSTGNGELIFAAWDADAQKSYVFDTGIRFNTILANKAALIPTTFSVDAAFTTLFGTDTSNLVWNLYAGSAKTSAADPTSNWGVMTTIASYETAMEKIATPEDPYLASASGNSLITAARTLAQNNANLALPTEPTPLDTSVNRSYVITSNASAASAVKNNWGIYNGKTTVNSAVASGESSYLIRTQRISNPETLGGYDSAFSLLGRATFDATTGIGSISTPVPAAAWLLVSGLAGFGAISRRRKQQQA
jgi:hypothetical protein